MRANTSAPPVVFSKYSPRRLGLFLQGGGFFPRFSPRSFFPILPNNWAVPRGVFGAPPPKKTPREDAPQARREDPTTASSGEEARTGDVTSERSVFGFLFLVACWSFFVFVFWFLHFFL